MDNVAMDAILAASGTPKQRFLVGDLVEVRMLEKGLRGSWHAGKVVAVLKGKRLVEYDHLLDEDEKAQLREFVPVGRASDGDNLIGTLPLKSTPKKSRPQLRPRPPVHPDSQPIAWQEGVWVECFYEDAWWEGLLAENITTVDVDDVTLVTRKSEVSVFFREENDVSQMPVNQMRIGQEWDEETGNWSLKGCVPVPLALPTRRAQHKESNSGKDRGASAPMLSNDTDTDVAAAAQHTAEPKATDVVIASELCDDSLAQNSLLKDLNGGSSDVALNLTAQEPGNACPTVQGLPLENEIEGNTTEDAQEVDKVDVSVPMDVEKNNAAAQNEEAAQTVLTHAGWKITRSVRRKTGEVIWHCRSPKVAGTAVKTFSSLGEALSYEAHRGAPGGNLQDARSLSQSSSADKETGNEPSAARNNAAGEDEDESDEYGASVREILVKAGWEVFGGLRTGSGGQRGWLYRTPRAGNQPRKWFKNWRLASGEYVKQETTDSTPNQKKRASRGGNLSSVPSKRVSRRLASPQIANKLADGSGPSLIRAEEVPKSMFPVLTPGDYSDVGDDPKREVDIAIHSGRRRTVVDLGQEFTRSDNTSSTGNSYLEKPFGSVFNSTQEENAYIVQVATHDFLKEQISVLVEKGEIIIKARYCKEEQFDNVPVRYNGSMSSRLAIPKDVERPKITAELKSSVLTLTLPKSVTSPGDSLEIKIQ